MATIPIAVLLLVITFGTIYGEEAPEFLTKAAQHTVKEGETVTLPCRVRNLGDYAVMWKRNQDSDSLIFINRDPFISDDRFGVAEDGWDLTITNVEGYDSGDYTCELSTSPQMKLVQHLEVLVPPTVSIEPDISPHVAKPGEGVQFTCYGAGNPQPNITWRRVGGTLIDGSQVLHGRTYHIPDVTVDHEGVYECTVENGVGEAAKAEVQLKIMSTEQKKKPTEGKNKPTARSAHDYVPVKIGESVNISCVYSAKPDPEIIWKFNGQRINLVERPGKYAIYGSTEGTDDVTILAIKLVDESDFGDYVCDVQNEMGSDEATVYVSGFPGPVSITHASAGMHSVSLEFEVESQDPITEYKVQYRRENQDLWQPAHGLIVPAAPSKKSSAGGPNQHRMEYIVEGLEPLQTYHIRVQAKNSLGWGALPREETVAHTSSNPSSTQSPGNKKEATSWSGGTKGAQTVTVSLFGIAFGLLLAILLL